MFGSIGGPELVLILIIALIVFGPRKLPEIGRTVGKMMVEFRRASNEFRNTIEQEVEAERHSPPAAQMSGPPPPPPAAAPERPAAEPEAAPEVAAPPDSETIPRT